MKYLLTIIASLLFGFSAMAQTSVEKQDLKKVATVSMNVQLDIDLDETVKNQEVVRLYRFKYSRFKKELKFRTKHHKSKLA